MIGRPENRLSLILAPRDIHFDLGGARRVATALRSRAVRQRKLRSAGRVAFADKAALTTWLWKKSRTPGPKSAIQVSDLSKHAVQNSGAIGTDESYRAEDCIYMTEPEIRAKIDNLGGSEAVVTLKNGRQFHGCKVTLSGGRVKFDFEECDFAEIATISNFTVKQGSPEPDRGR